MARNKMEKVPERTRVYMTRSMSDRVHYRLKTYAARKRIPLEAAVNLALERGVSVLEIEARQEGRKEARRG